MDGRPPPYGFPDTAAGWRGMQDIVVRSRARLLAQASVEWVLIVAIVGLGCVAAFRALSGEMGGVLGKTGNVLAQGDPVGPVTPDPGTSGGSGSDTPEPEPEPEATNETAYAMLYEDGSMVFQVGDEEDEGHGALVGKWNGWLDHEDGVIDTGSDGKSVWTPACNEVKWYDDKSLIKSVIFKDEIAPKSTNAWFYGCSNLASVDLSNLNASSVKDMSWMFSLCTSLRSLDVSHLDVRNVECLNDFVTRSGLTKLDLSSWDTPNLKNARAIVYSLPDLEYLDISGIDNRNAIRKYTSVYDVPKLKVLITGPNLVNNFEGIDPCVYTGLTWLDPSGASYTDDTLPYGTLGRYIRATA